MNGSKATVCARIAAYQEDLTDTSVIGGLYAGGIEVGRKIIREVIGCRKLKVLVCSRG